MCPRQGWMPRAGGLTWRVLVMEVASRLRVIHPSTWLAVPTGKLALIPDLATDYQRSRQSLPWSLGPLFCLWSRGTKWGQPSGSAVVRHADMPHAVPPVPTLLWRTLRAPEEVSGSEQGQDCCLGASRANCRCGSRCSLLLQGPLVPEHRASVCSGTERGSGTGQAECGIVPLSLGSVADEAVKSSFWVA